MFSTYNVSESLSVTHPFSSPVGSPLPHLVHPRYLYVSDVFHLFQIHSMRIALDDTRGHRDRLRKESEVIVENINHWVKEQK